MSKYYERHNPGPAQQVIALPIPARLVETFGRRGLVFSPTPQGESLSALFYFFWSAIVHFYTQKRVAPVDAAITEAAAAAGVGFAPLPPGAPQGPINPIDAAAGPGAPRGNVEMNEDGRETHFEYNNERHPLIAAFWETMHVGHVVKPAGYVLWIASWAPSGLTKLVSSHLKRCAAFSNDARAKVLCDPRYYGIKDPLILIRKIEEVFCAEADREYLAFMDLKAYKQHEKHPIHFFAPQRLRVFFPTGWSTSAGVEPGIERPPMPWFMQSIPYDALVLRECRWGFPLFHLEKTVAEILCNTGGVLTDTAVSDISDAIETAVREQTINLAAPRSDVFYEPQCDLLAYVRERNALEDGASEAERLEVGTRIFRELPGMMTLPAEENAYLGNVSRGQYVIFSSMDKIQLPGGAAYVPLFKMVTRDLSAVSNVLLKIVAMFHDHMGVHYGNRMCMTMSCFVNNLGCPRPYVGTGLLACIGLYGPKSLGKNRAHDAATLLMNKAALLPFASVTQAIFRTDSNYNFMKMSFLETPKELLGIDANGHPASTPLAESFKELLTSGGKIASLNFNGGTDKQNFRTTKTSNFQFAGSIELICNYDRAAIEKTAIGSRQMLLEPQTFTNAIDTQDADSFVDEHGGDSIENSLSAEGKAYVDRMRILFDIFYVYCAFQRMGLLPLLPEESVRMVLDGMNARLRKRGYDGYTMRVGTQMTNEVRALSTFLAIALWWEGGLAAQYRARYNAPFLNFAVLMEISRHVRVFEDAIVMVFSQNISLVQSPLRQMVVDELRKLLTTTAPGNVTVWNEHIVSDKPAPSPLVHGEESAQDAWLRENYVQLVVSVPELQRMLSDRLRVQPEEIKTALRQIRDREQCVVDGIARPVYKVKGAFTDQKGFFLKRWVISTGAETSSSIYTEFCDMLYKSMSMDKTAATRCLTIFPSEISGVEIGISRNVQVLSVPACIALERRAHVFETFSRPARSFYFASEGGAAARHRTTDGEWQQRGFPVSIPAEARVMLDIELVGAPDVSLDYPRGGLESAIKEHKERILGAELRRVLPRVMPNYSVYCDLWMPAARDASVFARLAFSSRSTISEAEEKEKIATLRAYQVARSRHQSSMYGVYAAAVACRRWCELVGDAKFDEAAAMERYIETVWGETTYGAACESFARLRDAQEAMTGLLTHRSYAEFTGSAVPFSFLIETLPVLTTAERAYCKLYVEHAVLRPIETQAAFIRPDYVASPAGASATPGSNLNAASAEMNQAVARATSTYDALRAALGKTKRGRRSDARGTCVFTRTQMLDVPLATYLPTYVKCVMQNVNMARRELISCFACGLMLTACALETEIEAVLSTLREMVAAASPADVSNTQMLDDVRKAMRELPLACLNVQNAWGNVRLQQAFPLRDTAHLMRFDAAAWEWHTEVARTNALPASVADVNRLFSLVGMPSEGEKLSAGEEDNELEGAAEAMDGDLPMLSTGDVAFSAGACWMSAYLFNNALPHEVMPAASAPFRRALLECADTSTARAAEKAPGRYNIVTPQSLSLILFQNEQ